MNMQRVSVSLLAGLTLLGAASTASAQFWGRGGQPQSGACFYEDINYGGRYFCTPVGGGNERVPSNMNDEISSIRLFGNAEVLVFRDGNMRGEARRFSSGVRDMRRSGFNDRLTSYVVQPRGYNGNYGGGGYGTRGGYGGGYDDGRYDNGRYDNGRYDNGRYDNGRYDNGRYDNGRYDNGRYDDGRYDNGRNGGRSSRWTYQQATYMVLEAYRRVFRREADRDARPWVDEVMKNNWSQRQLEQALRDTPEGRQR